ncbi:S8 family peptidase [Trichoderma guizhouense]|uniref:S8 family peptidase n=1 Tax=Trichoderma guizhouense TaxID=1491466 RepID=A0A1T3C4H0_9HYPO|nr:S8 family peptidase [Trichoderma guizhouense]
MDSDLNNRDCFLALAIPIFRALNDGLKERSFPPARRRLVMQIATNLALTHHALKSIPVYWIEPEVDELCQMLLANFAYMDNWAQHWRSNGPLNGIQLLFRKQPHTTDQMKNSSIIAFFKAPDTEHLISTIDNSCARLYKLIDDGNDDGGSVPVNFNSVSKTHLVDFSRDLFDALELHIQCKPSEPGSQDDHQSQAWHPARLCLIEEEHDFPSMSLLISPMQMAHWQDFHLTIEPEDSIVIEENATPQPAFCNLVDTPHYARVEIGFDPTKSQFQFHRNKKLETEPGPGRGENLADVLREFQLLPKDKIILAYTIAQAYHHFYDSDLMRIRWTSDKIWFMPPTEENDEIFLRPYLIFPFGTRDDPEEDFVDDARLVHQHPRILAIGTLLLEIGLSKPFQSIPQRNRISQANRDHKIADDWLKNFKKVEWGGLKDKSIFDKAIEYCIREGKMLVDRQNKLGPVGKVTDSSAEPSMDKQQGILARRKKFYKNVVRPLKYLAETGFGYKIGKTLCIRRKPRAVPLDTEVPDELSKLETSFHSGNTVKPKEWLKDLNSIGTIIERQRRTHGVKTAIRVAILDTGNDGGDSDSASWHVKSKRDFVDSSATQMTDTFGHGTLMARLVKNCAPSAEIIIARVAKNTKDLEIGQDNIKEAIIWAGVECQADIISMSFGFPRDHKGIDNAIKSVQAQRKESILFLASAGNSSFETENFPARHSSVISIYAANCRGTFMETNPRLPHGAAAILGTYGSEVPDKFCEDIQAKHPGVCQPGSSIATAVAAGICATMIAYAELLPYLEPSAKGDHRLSQLKLLRRKSGMEAVLKSMVKKNDDSRMWFVDPISFWRDTSDQDSAKHFTRYSEIHSCLQHISSQLADTS